MAKVKNNGQKSNYKLDLPSKIPSFVYFGGGEKAGRAV